MNPPPRAGPNRFDPAMLAGLDEPVRRYFTHALRGAAPSAGVRLTMTGRIKVGIWLRFRADWQGDGRSFLWRARAGPGPIRLLDVVDQFGEAAGSMDVRLLGRLRLVHSEDEDTARSGAGRATVEAATWSPASLLPARGVSWRAEDEHRIVASWDVPPEHPEVELLIDDRGAVQSASVMRWDNRDHGYIPFRGDIHAERRFGDLVIPSRVTVGWWFGTPDWAPFFEAEILSVESI